MKIGFIGAGKVGFSLGKYFKSKGQELSGYFSRTYNSAKDAADFTESLAFSYLSDLINESDILFITVNDDSIHDVWEEISKYDICGKILCHCSGLLTSEIFDGIHTCKASGISVHMLYAVSNKYTSFKGLQNAAFTIEGDEQSRQVMLSILSSFGNKVREIEAAHKVKYHAACCASNLMVALADMSASMLCECGFTYDEAQEFIMPLLVGSALNMKNQGIRKALTGPVDRNDVETVNKHLSCLDSNRLSIYTELSKILVDIAKCNHPENDYTAILKGLNDNEKHS